MVTFIFQKYNFIEVFCTLENEKNFMEALLQFFLDLICRNLWGLGWGKTTYIPYPRE